MCLFHLIIRNFTLLLIINKYIIPYKGIIYLIQDNICNKSYVGSTINSMKERFSTYKNHIKTGYKDCEIAKHFKFEPDKHPIFDPRSISFDNYLKSQISVIVIDKCDLSDCNTTKEKREKIQILEGQWKTHLHTNYHDTLWWAE